MNLAEVREFAERECNFVAGGDPLECAEEWPGDRTNWCLPCFCKRVLAEPVAAVTVTESGKRWTISNVHSAEFGTRVIDGRLLRFGNWLRSDVLVPRFLLVVIGLDVVIHFTGWLL